MRGRVVSKPRIPNVIIFSGFKWLKVIKIILSKVVSVREVCVLLQFVIIYIWIILDRFIQ